MPYYFWWSSVCTPSPAVSDYVDGKNYEEIDYTKRGILELYEADLEKYDDDNHNNKASAIFKSIPDQLENKNSHFKFSVIDKNARFQNYFEAIDFINKSMIGNTCINMTSSEVSLAATVDRRNFKLYMGDTGLLTTEIMKNGQKTDSNIYKSLIFGKISINEGMIFENMVSQMLKASGHELFFHEIWDLLMGWHTYLFIWLDVFEKKLTLDEANDWNIAKLIRLKRQ